MSTLDLVESRARIESWYLLYIDSCLACLPETRGTALVDRCEAVAKDGEAALPESVLVWLWHAQLLEQTGTAAELSEQVARTRALAERCLASGDLSQRDNCEQAVSMLNRIGANAIPGRPRHAT